MATFELDSEFVRKLAELLGETGLTEIEYAEGEKRIRLSRAAPAAMAPVAVAAAPVAAAPATAPVAAVPPAQHPGAVKSPMVGTAYLAPEPGAGTFVKVGDAVKVGQTLLIIEAMKVMNPIKATKAGTVTQIQVGDAQPVEYGEVLLIIE
ncbi:acetyl-CoA carboxylase biotin carboxyl carrier protein [Nitrospirillum viridazoti]|uniref:Biotin carboxyl carrier protein of acetyl-CoA carboxylase n=1 Tax=Nitrospirillum viridazoti CBAmc TaxID=1441467 RepID=A0A248JU18_9PROT|nr:acetyl-CoA carboxylase biotin carboxyl carrier protein [Nitrospirillum amazonense]ASG22099.1 acetyl-CoA carboxylase, biotin carboxyl carrier protein [Nitrospirillum amazonense CBAmc]TWB32767.1 acetyl-CoA carboxylase biotin carboxyl carrier protein [Nitrospirillum amazonense]